MGRIENGVINTFVDGDVVSADGSGGSANALNPKMQLIQVAVDDNDTRIGILEGQLASLGTTSVRYNVKAAPFNAVGNGIADDTAAIQAAINEAVTNQGIVVFPTGIYKITDKLTIAGNCSLVSDGASSGSYISQHTVAESIYITGSNVSISNLIFRTNTNTSTTGVIANPTATAASPHSNITIVDCQFYDAGANVINGIILYHANNVRIENCSFTNSVALGVVLYSCSKTFIYRNTFQTTNVAVTVTRVAGSLATYPQTIDTFISQNNITPVAMSGTYAISVLGAINTYVDRNNIKIPAAITTLNRYAIFVSSSGLYLSQYVQIADNYIDNSEVTGEVNLLGGIYIGTGMSVSISRNSIIECYYAIKVFTVTDTIVSSNSIITPNLVGIDITSANIIVTGNFIVDVYDNVDPNPTAIQINLSSIFPSNVTVSGNAVRLGTSGATYLNVRGVYSKPTTGSGLTTNGAYVNCSGNSFTACATPISQSNTLFWTYYELPTGDRVFYSPTGAAPAAGTWRQGDQVILLSPVAGGYIGYVCTTAGTPGTWKGYGAIQP